MPDARASEFPTVSIPVVTARRQGGFGRLAELGAFLADRGVRGPARPRLIVVAGDHGVAGASGAGVSAQRPGATAEAVDRIRGGAGVATLAGVAGAGVLVADVAVDRPAPDAPYRVRAGSGRIDREDALSGSEVDAALRVGRALADAEVDGGTDLLLVGHVGAGATTPAGVIVAALAGVEPIAVVGRGSGIDDPTWMRKAAAVRDGLRRVRAADQGPADRDPAALLRIAGGADLAVLAGLVAQAAVRQAPVVLDGVVTVAAALVGDRLAPGARAWWLAAHAEPEPAHRIALEQLGLTALLDLQLTAGDGTGALAALPLIRMAGALGVAAPEP